MFPELEEDRHRDTNVPDAVKEPAIAKKSNNDGKFGISGEVIIRNNKNDFQNSNQETERQSTFSQSDSTTISLPIINPILDQSNRTKQTIDSRWKALIARPVLRQQETRHFHELLLEAILILHEAEISKSTFHLNE